ncbi:MAG: hydroxymethylglutaryl-CoA reductase, degradative [Loktanella sp.]|nr:hydroxymethylglutaryl-CoA reductase, degradative [Loktanella sp.]
MTKRSSRLSGFATLSRDERIAALSEWLPEGVDASDILNETGALPGELVERMVENAIGVMPVPLGVATNMIVDGKDVLVPMATEESSVIAAVGNAAKRCRAAGGFRTSYAGSLTIAQVQILDVADPHRARLEILRRFEEIRDVCNQVDPMLVDLGGGLRDVEVRLLDGRHGTMVVVHLIVDTKDAMGANAVNTMAERIAPVLAGWTGGRSLLRILSNLADRRLTRAEAVWPATEVGGAAVVDTMLEAADFAVVDPYRAATHNKGIMNGVSAVVLATGNDTRAIEAGAHAYAGQSGHYSPLTRWEKTESGDLAGSIEIPLSLGIVGGATRIHPVARLALAIMGTDSAEALSRCVAAVGLAQNFSAVRALATDGIQKGHMALHAQNIAIAAGAEGDEIMRVADAMKASGEINERAAKTLLADMRA